MAEVPITLEYPWFSSTTRTTGPCCGVAGAGDGVGVGVGVGAGGAGGAGGPGGAAEVCGAVPGEDGLAAWRAPPPPPQPTSKSDNRVLATMKTIILKLGVLRTCMPRGYGRIYSGYIRSSPVFSLENT